MKKILSVLILLLVISFCYSQTTTINWGVYDYGVDFNLNEPVSFEGEGQTDSNFFATAYHIPSNTKVLNNVQFTYNATLQAYSYPIPASNTATWKTGMYEAFITVTDEDGNFIGKAIWQIDYNRSNIKNTITTSENNIINKISDLNTTLLDVNTDLATFLSDMNSSMFDILIDINTVTNAEGYLLSLSTLRDYKTTDRVLFLLSFTDNKGNPVLADVLSLTFRDEQSSVLKTFSLNDFTGQGTGIYKVEYDFAKTLSRGTYYAIATAVKNGIETKAVVETRIFSGGLFSILLTKYPTAIDNSEGVDSSQEFKFEFIVKNNSNEETFSKIKMWIEQDSLKVVEDTETIYLDKSGTAESEKTIFKTFDISKLKKGSAILFVSAYDEFEIRKIETEMVGFEIITPGEVAADQVQFVANMPFTTLTTTEGRDIQVTVGLVILLIAVVVGMILFS